MTVIHTPADRLHFMNELLDPLVHAIARSRDSYLARGRTEEAARVEGWLQTVGQLQVHVGLLTAELDREDTPRA